MAPVEVMRSILPRRVANDLSIGAIGIVANCNEEIAVWSKVKRAAVVVCGSAQIGQVHHDRLTASQCNVARGGEAADAVVNSRSSGGVVDIDQLVGDEVGIECDSKQATLTVESTVTVRKGVGSRTPFLITRNAPPCWQTKMRPSGARAMAVGLFRPPATTESVNPGGTVAACTLAAVINRVKLSKRDELEVSGFHKASTAKS